MKTTEIINARIAKRIAQFVDADLIENGRLLEVTVEVMDKIRKDGKVQTVCLGLDKSVSEDDDIRELRIDIDKFENNLLAMGLDPNTDLEDKKIQLICLDECAGNRIWVPGKGGSWDDTTVDYVHYIGGII